MASLDPTFPTHTHTHTHQCSPPRDIFAQASGSMPPKKRRAYHPSGTGDVSSTVVRERDVSTHPPGAKDSGGMVCRCLLPSCRFCGPCSSQGHRMVDEALVASLVDTSQCACCMPGCRYCAPAAVSTERQAYPQPRARKPRRKQGHKRPLSQELAMDSGEDSGPEKLFRLARRPATQKKLLARWRAVKDASPGISGSFGVAVAISQLR